MGKITCVVDNIYHPLVFLCAISQSYIDKFSLMSLLLLFLLYDLKGGGTEGDR